MATYLQWTLPMPVVAAPGSSTGLPDVLTHSFGNVPGDWNDLWVTYYPAGQLAAWDFNYWNPATAAVGKWYVNGSDIGGGFNHQRYVPGDAIATAAFHAGNDIGPLAYVTVPISGSSGSYAEYIQYSIITIDPHVISPVAGHGEPTPQDIVDSAYRFANYFGLVPNDNDCHFIAAAVAAATGSTLPDATQSLDPTQNEEGGFWRIAYRGSDPSPVQHWQSLVHPGDIVRMGWIGGGQHTLTVLAVNADHSLVVYDNTYPDGQGGSEIGVHTVNYDDQTIPSTITIYRLTTDGLYLEKGSDLDEALPGTSFDDHVLGLGGNDHLAGALGNDWLEGGAGADVLDGGPGADKLVGGVGNDTYVVDNAGDTVIENPGEGTDSVQTSLNAYTLPDNVENLTFTGSGAFSGFGNALGNTLTGGAGADVLDGGSGVDTLVGLGGDDLYYVQNSATTVTENAGQGFDSVIAYVTYTLPANVEAIYTLAGAGATGNGLDNLLDGAFAGSGQTLDGGGGNDVIYGTLFDDTLMGGAGSDALYDIGGNDTMQGGSGDDAYFVNSAADAVQENAGEGQDAIYASVNYTLPANVEVLEPYGSATRGDGNDDANVLLGVASDHALMLDGHGGNDVIYGSNFDDTLIGGAGDDLLWGFGGNDTMQGGTGNDTYIVEQAGDAVQENPGEGNDSMYASVNFTLPANVENLFVYGGATSGSGNSGDNLIVNEFITSGVTLTGGGGNDTFVFIPHTANGSTITDFVGNGAAAGDVLQFVAYGAGATFTNVDATHWQVNYNGGASHDVITFSNSPAIDPAHDVLFA